MKVLIHEYHNLYWLINLYINTYFQFMHYLLLFTGCTVDIGIGFDISRGSSHSLFSGQYSLQTFLPEIIRHISTVNNLCCLPGQPVLQTNIGFRLVASDGKILHDINFEPYSEASVKKVMDYNKTQALAFNTQLLHSFQNKFAASKAGVKVRNTITVSA